MVGRWSHRPRPRSDQICRTIRASPCCRARSHLVTSGLSASPQVSRCHFRATIAPLPRPKTERKSPESRSQGLPKQTSTRFPVAAFINNDHSNNNNNKIKNNLIPESSLTCSFHARFIPVICVVVVVGSLIVDRGHLARTNSLSGASPSVLPNSVIVSFLSPRL